jgi:hypothetical protein
MSNLKAINRKRKLAKEAAHNAEIERLQGIIAEQAAKLNRQIDEIHRLEEKLEDTECVAPERGVIDHGANLNGANTSVPDSFTFASPRPGVENLPVVFI